jgi:putative ABC transport system permease protein
VVSVVGRLFSWSVPGRLGRLNSSRNPRRTAITAAALMVGVALITGVNTVITSADTSLRGTAQEQITADLIVYGQGSPDLMPTYDPALIERFARVDGVEAVAAQFGDVGTVGGERQYLIVIDDVPAYAAMFGVRSVTGAPLPALRPYELILDDAEAARSGLKVGDRVPVQLARGEAHDYTVAAIYPADTFNAGTIAATSALDGMRNRQPAFGFLTIADGADQAAVKARVNALLTDNPEMSAVTRTEYLDTQLGQVSQLLIIVQVLLGLAILIAVLGVVNTLALSVLERTRELGLLRAIGLGRWATIRMITVEAVVITLFGALLGLGVGAGLGAAIVKALADDGLTTLALPWQQMGVYLLLGALVGVVAAVVPALRGSRINILAAIAHD